jgi:Cytochrome c554 and c-prime
MKRILLRVVAGVALCWLAVAAPRHAAAQARPSDSVHLGVASCAGSTCHGAVQRLKGSSVAQDEYIIWSRKDKHAKAYEVLGEPRSQRIARNLGLGDARKAQICLDCHADNVPPALRGPQFQISDGVGCEACHGGAKSWLGVHISGATHREDIAAGMYPTDDPRARAEKCLSCHFGDDTHFMTHRIMGAGHPRLSFELDTFTAAEPAHFVVDKTYIQRKGPVNDVRVWAVGQAVSLVKLMDAVLDPKRAPQGLFPDLVLFDCTACHHSMTALRWQPDPATGLPPGAPRLSDANAVMLRIIAARIAPEEAKTIADHMLALHRATTVSWQQVQREARIVRDAANRLIPVLEKHDYTSDDTRALGQAVIEAGLDQRAATYPDAEQTTMALSSVISEMKLSGAITGQRAKTMFGSLNGLYQALADNDLYRPQAFVTAVRDFQHVMGQAQPKSGP